MKIYINGTELEADKDDTVLQAASKYEIKIPTLCFMKGISKGGVCGICLVEADGKVVRACTTKITEGMQIMTDTDEIKNSRREVLLKLAERHRFDCEFCPRCMDCEFIRILAENGIYDYEYQRKSNVDHREYLTGNIVHDDTLCIGCCRCVAVCHDGSVTMGKTENGLRSKVNQELFSGSGECVVACPTAAFSIDETESIRAARRAIHDKTCYAIISPDAAAVFGEMLFDPAGEDFSGKMAAIMRKLGYKKVFLADSHASVAAISKAVKTSEDIVTLSVSTITGPERPGADIDITIQTLLTIFRRACVSRTTMIHVWRETQPEAFDQVGNIEPVSEASYEFGGAMPHRDCYYSNWNDLPAIRQMALARLLNK